MVPAPVQDMCSLTLRAPWNNLFPYNPQPAGQTNHSQPQPARQSASVATLGTVLTAEIDLQKAAGNTVILGLDKHTAYMFLRLGMQHHKHRSDACKTLMH